MSTDIDTIAMLRDSLERFGAGEYNMLKRAPRLALPGGFCPDTWGRYAQFGWLSLCLPEDLGGLDADAVAVGAVLEVVGSRLLLEPVLASAVLATSLLRAQGSAQQQAELLPAIAEGRLVIVPAFGADSGVELNGRLDNGQLSGVQPAVLHGDVADHFLVAARDAHGQVQICLVDANASGVERKTFTLVDGRGAANLHFSAAAVTVLQAQAGAPSAEQTLAELRDQACVALCAEVQGITSSLLRITTDYLKVRQQFGKPLAANQALHHRMADLYLLTEEIRALTRAAQQAMTLPIAERAHLLHGVRSYVSDAGRRIGNEAVQLHGGVGITEELDVSHYFRRLMVNAALFGRHDEHLARFIDLSLGHPEEPEHA
jgi:alkylation response protein AidB-like acyl-CoA dehydrogenase